MLLAGPQGFAVAPGTAMRAENTMPKPVPQFPHLQSMGRLGWRRSSWAGAGGGAEGAGWALQPSPSLPLGGHHCLHPQGNGSGPRFILTL